jgi:hypothetical protein
MRVFSEIAFQKFLPNCQPKFFYPYIEQFVHTVKEWHQVNSHSNCLSEKRFLEIQQEIYQKYEQVRIDASSQKSFYIRFWNESTWADTNDIYITEGREFYLTIMLTQIPHIRGNLMTPYETAPFNDHDNQKFFDKYSLFCFGNLQTQLIDVAVYSDFEGESTFGSRRWIFFKEKILRIWFEQLFFDKGFQPDLFLPFEFVEQSLSSVNLMEQIIKLTRYESRKTIRKFLKKQDQLLLDTWGKEGFANRLQPLGISLEKWLKAV